MRRPRNCGTNPPAFRPQQGTESRFTLTSSFSLFEDATVKDMAKTLMAIKRYSRSVKTSTGEDGSGAYVFVTPAFQQPYKVRSLAEWEESVRKGWCAVPDAETCF